VAHPFRPWLDGVLAFCLLTVSAPAQLLYGLQDEHLLLIDTQTLAVTSLDLDWSDLGALTRAPDGTLYALDAGLDALVTIDPVTGQVTVVGTLGANVTLSTGLTCNPVTGQLYGITHTAGISVLSIIDARTGSATTVGPTGAEFVVGLDVTAGGRLLGIDGTNGANEELVIIGASSGLASAVNPQGLANVPHIGGFAIDSQGRAWAVHQADDRMHLLDIDLTAGTATHVGALVGITHLDGGMLGLTCAGEAPLLGSP
jgi:hypothetical protein